MDLSWVNNLPEDLRQVLLGKAEEALAKNALADYRPYAKQRVFHRAGADLSIRERLLKAGNQLGKCATARSYIEHPDGTRSTFGDLYASGVPFPVMAWDGEKAVKAWAVRPIRKPPEPCVRLWFSDGSWFESALNHRVLLTSGQYAFVRDLLASIPGHDHSARGEGAAHSTGTLRGFRAGCLAGLRFGDGLLHRAAESVRSFSRLLAGVPQRSSAASGSGAWATRCTSSGQSGFGRPSSLGGLRHCAALVAASLDRAACTFARYTTAKLQAAQRTVLGSIGESPRVRAVQKDQLQGAWAGSGMAGNHIVAYETVGSHEVFDFTVPVHENYIANGIAHHNTWSAGFETAMHLTGRYPDWWDGAVFDGPVSGWAAGVTGEVTRDSVQRVLCGRKNAMGTGAIPADAIKARTLKRGVADAIDTVVVKWGGGGDVQAKESLLGFKSYDQGREKFQAETLDFVWLDEEPDDLEIYTEALTRTNATQGIVYMTFTPLKGMTDVVKRFLIDKVTGTHVTNMTIHDAEHYTPEQRIQIINSYPAHEREARANGTPMLGSGRIFPIAEDVLMERPVSIPYHWKRIAGLDFGWQHPTAAVWVAWDQDTDIAHVYDAYRVKEATPVMHAAAIRARGEWIPVAWPHDGLQHDKGSGETLANQYRAQNVNMLKDRATHAPNTDNGEKEGEGGNGVEAGLMDMLDRMQTGRLKVAKHLEDWWEEFRLYHRKDGKIVKEGDDLMSATRYALMMLRHAKTNQAEAPRRRLMSPDVGTVQGMGPLG